MNRHCAALYFILFALATQEIQSSSLETLPNAWTSQSGEVPINMDLKGFYVEVEFSYNPSKSQGKTKMLLALSNSETLLPRSCAFFDSYNCNQHNCKEDSNLTANIDYPSISTLAYRVTTDAYLEYHNWKLKTYAYISKTCTGDTTFGYGRGGIIGFGSNDGSWQNFIGSKTFSIYFDKNVTAGKLLFRNDPSLATSAPPLLLNTDNNWRIHFSIGKIQIWGLFINMYYPGTLIFEVHAKAIGFPESIFGRIIDIFRMTQNMSCSADRTHPICDYHGFVSDLPTLKLTVNSTVIDLPPSVYVKHPSPYYQTRITLNFQALSPSLTGTNYVTKTFQNAIILDAQFMSYYYTVFENSQVKLYVQGTPSPKANGTELIIFSVVGLILVTSVCVCIFKKKKKLAEPSLPSSQDPLTNQPSDNPVPVQPNNGYVYPQKNNPVVHQNGQYDQYAQQPAGYVRQPVYYPPLPIPQQQQSQQPGNVNYGA